jgi:LPS export ABC transporter protein LptC
MPKVIIIIIAVSFLLGGCAPHKDKRLVDKEDASALSTSGDKILDFCLDGVTSDGKKRWSINGDSVEITSNSSLIDIIKLTAKVYDQEGNVTLTADKGQFDREKNIVHAQSNVVITNSDGVYLNTDYLNWDANTQQADTDDFVTAQKDNWQVCGLGAFTQQDLKKVLFKQENTVLIQPDTVITCSGPLNVDYEKNLAVFEDDVIITRKEDRIFSDKMDVFFDAETKKITRAVALGNVKIEHLNNSTFSQKAVYLAGEGKIILTGQPQLFIYPKQGN